MSLRDHGPPTTVECDGPDLVVSVRILDVRVFQLRKVLRADQPSLVDLAGLEMTLILRQKGLQLLPKLGRELGVDGGQEGEVEFACVASALELVALEERGLSLLSSLKKLGSVR